MPDTIRHRDCGAYFALGRLVRTKREPMKITKNHYLICVSILSVFLTQQ